MVHSCGSSAMTRPMARNSSVTRGKRSALPEPPSFERRRSRRRIITPPDDLVHLAGISSVGLHRRLCAVTGDTKRHHTMVPRQHGTAVCDRVFMIDEYAFIHEAFIAPEALRTERKAPTVVLRKPSPPRGIPVRASRCGKAAGGQAS